MQLIRSLVISVLFVLTQNAFSLDLSACDTRECLAVVDAGSSGTRLHIYAYDLNKANKPVNIEEAFVKRINMALGKLFTGHATINTYLDTLFSDVDVKKMPVYFYATAGMRLHSHVKQQAYYELIKNWFDEQNQWQLMEAKTITGKEEGLFGWLSVNYTLGGLDDENIPLVGVMDMGGASVQVVFPIEDISQVHPLNFAKAHVHGKDVLLFTHSFLGLGEALAASQFLNQENCYPYLYNMPNEQPGMGNAYACRDDVTKLINHVHGVNELIQPALKTNPVKTWYTIGGLPMIVHSEPFDFDHYQFTNQDLLKEAYDRICQQNWPDLHQRFGHDEHLYSYCFRASYYHALMVNGYGIEANHTIHYLPDAQNHGWTLGVVLQHH